MHNQSQWNGVSDVILYSVITVAVWQENVTARVTFLRQYLRENVTGR